MLDLTGCKFGLLTVLKIAEKRKKTIIWLCECECGNQAKVCRSNLRNGHSKSCGCLKRRKFSESKTWQGYEDISMRTWSDIRRKAIDRKLDFQITIEDAWNQYVKQKKVCNLTGWSISLFCPKFNYAMKTASLDRINSDKGYLKDNIQWVHKDVNLMKNWFPNERFLQVCEAVALCSQMKK